MGRERALLKPKRRCDERRLLSYERTRDYRFAAERTESDVSAWTDVVRSYVGDQYSIASDG